MSRHSKNNTAAPCFTYHERKMLKNKYGTINQRLGSDSQLSFGQCQICLHTLNNPQACQKGHLFCRNCIIEHLGTQKKQIKLQEKELLEKQSLQQKIEQEAQQKLMEKKQEEFKALENSLPQANYVLEETLEQMNAGRKQMSQSEFQKLKEKEKWLNSQQSFDTQKNYEKTQISFWMASSQADFIPKEKKIATLQCPLVHDIALKQLQQIQLFQEEEKVYCWSCKEELVYQRLEANIPCGHVLCDRCAKLDKERCGKCDGMVKSRLKLQAGGSSYSFHNDVVGKVQTPAFQG